MTVNPAWTVTEAQEAHDSALAADPARSPNDPTLPLYQWFALHTIEQERARFETGDRMALLAAIRKCAQCGLVMPAWVVNAYSKAYFSVVNCDAKSWDEVFGTPYAKGSQINAMRKRRHLRPAVWLAVHKILGGEPGTAIDTALFERVGAMMDPPVGRSVASELYYESERMFTIGKTKDP